MLHKAHIGHNTLFYGHKNMMKLENFKFFRLNRKRILCMHCMISLRYDVIHLFHNVSFIGYMKRCCVESLHLIFLSTMAAY